MGHSRLGRETLVAVAAVEQMAGSGSGATRGWDGASSPFWERLQLVTWGNFVASPLLW